MDPKPDSELTSKETTNHRSALPPDAGSTAQMAPPSLNPVPDAVHTGSDPQSTAQTRSAPPSDPQSTAQTRSAPPSDPHSTAQMMYPAEHNNPYVAPAALHSSSSSKNTMETVKGVLSRWGKKVGVATKKAEDFSRNTWQHLKTGPSIADVAMGRIAQTSKIIAEGGHERIFRRTFESSSPEEELRKYYACYLSTSAGPVAGVLYVSTGKIAFCSDGPVEWKAGDETTEWSYYKVVVPLNQLRAVNPSLSQVNQAEKFIQVVSIDNHEFWFMGFVNYDSAVKNLQQIVPQIHPQLQP
ncbi:hypothetical protein LUZ60_002667 [Juncus effusus]|nr:hypothetical protein LUZ60_002667 [Juncus effusus]